MTKLDQYESAFRSADKVVYVYERIEPREILLVSDVSGEVAERLLDSSRRFLSVLAGDEHRWQRLDGDGFDSVGSLLEAVESREPDLIVTYRHLHSNAWQWPYSLGEHLDVLTQATDVPVIVLPHPDAGWALPHSLQNTDRVMAITDHLSGDDRLVNWALRFTEPGGACWLTHVESGADFDRLLDVIAKIPEIETETARVLIQARLLMEATDYIEFCRKAIEAQGLDVRLEPRVSMGHRLSEYRRLVEEHRIDLLVMNTLDGEQLAMHGHAYPLAIELRQIPLLML